MKKLVAVAGCVVSVGIAACTGSDDKEPEPAAVAAIAGPNGLTGTAEFTLDGAAVTLDVVIDGAAPVSTNHGIHLHQVAVCTSNFTSAGGHWNPAGSAHGQPGSGHAGDLGNIAIDATGHGTLTYSNPAWTVTGGTASNVIGRAIIIHALPDDFGQPTGNAGGRIGCGAIVTAP